MLRTIADRDQISSAQGRLRELVKEGAGRGKALELGFRGGKLPATVYWRPDLGVWAALEQLDNRYWNAFGLGDPKIRSNLPIVVEVNPPLRSIDRRTGGVFAADESRAVYLLHRGRVGGGRRGIGKAGFLRHCQRWGRTPETISDGDRNSQAITITSLDDPRAPAYIASFVQTVARFKEEVARGTTSPAGSGDGFTAEFSGQKVVPPRDRILARCRHGTIVNALAAELDRRGRMAENDQRRDLFVRDSNGRIRILFEVKPDFETTSIYGAVGQLVLHASVERPPIRVAVLPWETPKSMVANLAERDIRTLLYRWRDQSVLFPGLTNLLSQS